MEIPMMAYGAQCTWWDDKDKVGVKPSGLPCCPDCGKVLYEMFLAQWWDQVNGFAPWVEFDYRAFIEWLRGKCFPSYNVALETWRSQNGQSNT